ncbi:MAG: hypothetical protein PVS3B3_07130 [Ktedonobacteraceae bacterium]
MKPYARFWGKRRFAGFLIILAVSISLVGLSIDMFAHFNNVRKEPKVNVAPIQTSTLEPISNIPPDVSATHTPSTTATPTGTALPSNTTTPTTRGSIVPSTAATPTSETTPRSTIVASPLLFGTNLVLADGNDQVLTSSVTQNLLEQIHVQMIRMPIRTGTPESVNVLAAQTIKQMGAVPLIILHSSQAQASNIMVITDMNRIFGSSIVYYEFGNEDDFLGVPAPTYTASWNANIPALKHKALNGWFIGPVNYHYDDVYLTYFLSHATPLPDAVSWHEYGCRPNDSTDFCIAHLANWTVHFQNARAIISTTGKVLPIMITEWNYDATATLNDGKNNNSTFMHDWTMAALQILAENHIFASMQYACTYPVMPLVTTSGTLTSQGTAFRDSYRQLVPDH